MNGAADGDADRRWRRARRQVLVATWFSYAGFYVCRKVFAIVKVPLAEALHWRDLDVAKLWTLFLIAYMLGQFLSAALGRSVGSRRLLLLGMALATLATAASGLVLSVRPAWGFFGLGALLVLHGTAQATGWPGNIGLLSQWTRREERGLLLGIWGTCYQLGAAGAKLLAAFLLGALGLAWPFFGASLILGLSCLLFYAYGHESPEQLGLHSAATSETASALPATAATAANNSDKPAELEPAQLLRLAIVLGLIYFCFKFLRYAIDSWSALILTRHFAKNVPTAGYLSAVFDVCGFFGVLIGGWLSDRLTHRRCPVIFGMTVGVLVVTLIMIALGQQSTALFVGGIAILGLLLMGPDSLISGTVAMDRGGRGALLAAGVINGFGSIGPIVQEPLIGWLLGRYGLQSVYILLGVAAALATLGTGLLWRWSHVHNKAL